MPTSYEYITPAGLMKHLIEYARSWHSSIKRAEVVYLAMMIRAPSLHGSFSAQWGIYLSAGQTFYYIESPLFSSSSLDLGGGKPFVIKAIDVSESNRYVQSAVLNGEPINRVWLKHTELISGGMLTLTIVRSHPSGSLWIVPPVGVEQLANQLKDAAVRD